MLELLSKATRSSRPGDAIAVNGRKESGHYILRLSDERVGLPQENLESEARSDCSTCLRLTLPAC